MRAVDTNILVRLLTRDEPAQYRTAVQFFEDCRRIGEQVLISAVVLCELVWVLKSNYGLSKDLVLIGLAKLEGLDGIVLESADEVRTAIDQWTSGRGDFADYVIRQITASCGCSDVVTFDRALTGAPGFTVLR